jgi:hypothetical protein
VVKKRVYLVLLILLVLAAGCQAGSGVVVAPPVNTATPNSVVAPENNPEDSLDTYRVPASIPQPAPGTGTITGQIDTSNLKDLRGLLIYLGELIVVDETHLGGYLDTTDAPSTIVDLSNGKFYFKDVIPGEYSLIFYEIGIGGKALTDDTGSVMPILIEENKITDLGKLKFEPGE